MAASQQFLTMGDIDQISQLLGELKANQERFLDEISDLRRNVQSLNAWRWQAAGFISAVVIIAKAVELLFAHK